MKMNVSSRDGTDKQNETKQKKYLQILLETLFWQLFRCIYTKNVNTNASECTAPAVG